MHTSTVFRLALALGLSVVSTPALAKKKRNQGSSCDAIRPAQALPSESRLAVDSMVQAGLPGVGKLKVGVDAESDTSYDTKLLADDDLARAWYTYQLCVMKESDVVNQSLHDELLRSAWGLPPEEPLPTPETAATNIQYGLGDDPPDPTDCLFIAVISPWRPDPNERKYPGTVSAQIFYQNRCSSAVECQVMHRVGIGATEALAAAALDKAKVRGANGRLRSRASGRDLVHYYIPKKDRNDGADSLKQLLYGKDWKLDYEMKSTACFYK